MLKSRKELARVALSLWLIATGLLAVMDAGFPSAGLVLNLLAIVAGALILLQGGDWSATIGMALLGAWLVVRGVVAVIDVGVPGIGTLLHVVAVVAGLLILVER